MAVTLVVSSRTSVSGSIGKRSRLETPLKTSPVPVQSAPTLKVGACLRRAQADEQRIRGDRKNMTALRPIDARLVHRRDDVR
ncbi:hypothetical protein ABZ845_12340 [Streptomyces sp. NPDC047022]|uniref:hypothetical protein n=1 Tax=Streptomyces sp. NPDC047022 TaxID=3155737 RepID=UPI00340F5462